MNHIEHKNMVIYVIVIYNTVLVAILDYDPNTFLAITDDVRK